MLTMTQSLANIALILGALTAGGGITGYVRTGSVPSVVAGVTVGSLVSLCSATASVERQLHRMRHTQEFQSIGMQL